MPSFGWHHDWAMEICEPIRLPRLAWPSEIAGTVHARAAAETGLAVGTPVVAGTIDAFAEAYSVGVRDPGDLMIMYGSTMFCIQVLADYYAHPSLRTTAGVELETHLLAGGTATAGSMTNWLRGITGNVDHATMLTEVAQVPVGSDGLLVVPYLAGERTPVFDPHARGVMAGLTLRHSRGHLFRAAYEGIAFSLRHILDLFDESTRPVTRAVAVGGGVHSPLWTSIVSDITGRTQLIPRQTIEASYGRGPARRRRHRTGAGPHGLDGDRPGGAPRPGATGGVRRALSDLARAVSGDPGPDAPARRVGGPARRPRRAEPDPGPGRHPRLTRPSRPTPLS